MIRNILIVGTGLLGGSTGLALRASGFRGEIAGWDKDPAALETALRLGAITAVEDPFSAAKGADIILLAGPVLTILDWMERLAPMLGPHQLVTDVGSTKQQIAEAAARYYNRPGQAACLPGHPMAGKEVSGAEHADAALFRGAVWLFTPTEGVASDPRAAASAAEFRERIEGFGCRTLDMDARRHDELLAWVSHLPQFLSTALTALFQDEFGADPDLRAIGGRAMREMTRLGSSPYSMWHDIALTNTEPVERALLALERRLGKLREDLRTPELEREFERANQFRGAKEATISAVKSKQS
jgi:prephenate dehydrogenase